MAKEVVPDCCEECIKWEEFGKGCWVFWESKRECTQKITDSSEMPLK
ncbi:MAG: hypothetical protein ABIC04_07295 [Nanoarchaeota archaeon]